MQTRNFRAFLAIGTVTAISIVSFFVAQRLSTSQSVAPNAPESKAEASAGKNQKTINTDAQGCGQGCGSNEYCSAGRCRPIGGKADGRSDAEKAHDAILLNPTKPAKIITNTPTPKNTPTPIPGTFGTTGSGQGYMSKESNQCEDEMGFISGTGCFKNPTTGKFERRVLNIPATQKAYQEHVSEVSEKISNMTDEELLKIAKENNIASCDRDEDPQVCNDKAIAFATKIVLDNNLVINKADRETLTSSRAANQAVTDALTLSDDDFRRKHKRSRTEVLLQNNVPNATSIANAGGLISTYLNSKTPASDLINYICKTDNACKNHIRTQNIDNIFKSAVNDPVYTAYVEQAIKNKNYSAKAQTYTNLFLNPNISDSNKIDQFCKEEGIDQALCHKNIEINDLAAYSPNPGALIQLKTDYSNQRIINDPNNDIDDLKKIFCPASVINCNIIAVINSKIQDQTIKSNAEDSILLKIYSDIQNGTLDMARTICNGKVECINNFTNEDLLKKISNTDIRQQAINNRNLQLFNYIVPVTTGQQVSGIDLQTKKEIQDFNTDYQHAYWAFWKEQTQTKGKEISCPTKNGVTTCTGNLSPTELNDKLAQDFFFVFTTNPQEFNKYLSQYIANPKNFTDLQAATAFKSGQDLNSSIITLTNQAIKAAPIAGLAQDGKVVNWSEASEEYKDIARERACKEDSSISYYCGNFLGSNSKDPATLAAIDKAAQSGGYLKKIYEESISNLPSSFYSNVASIDNYTIPQEVRNQIINEEKQKIISQLIAQNHTRAGNQTAFQKINALQNTSAIDFFYNGLNLPSNITKTDIQKAVQQNIEQKYVTETFARGGGVAATLATAGLATIACSALGPGAAFCGAAGLLAGTISTYVPILGTVTAEEMAAEQQKIKDIEIGGKKIFESDVASGIIQSLYSNQGAACEVVDDSGLFIFGGDIAIGGSCTRKNNRFANFQSITDTFAQNNANLSNLSDDQFTTQLALQGYLNQQYDALQKENQTQAIINIASAPIVGYLTGAAGGNIANTINKVTAPSLSGFTTEASQFLAGAVVNNAQTYLQVKSTEGFTDTPEEIALQVCIRQNGTSSNKCENERNEVTKSNKQALAQNLIMANASDLLIQSGQLAISISTNLISKIPKSNSSSAIPETTLQGDPRILNPNTNIELDNAIAQIARNVAESSQTELESLIRNNPKLDNTDKQMLVYATQNTSFKNYMSDPNQENLKILVNDLKATSNVLNGGNELPPTPYLDTLISLHDKLQDIPNGQNNDSLISIIKSEAIGENNTPQSINSATPIEPYTEALQRLLGQRGRQNENLSIDQLNTLLEGIPLTEERIATLHKLQDSPEFINSAEQIARTITESEKARNTLIELKSPTADFDDASQRMIFDLTTELAQDLDPKPPTDRLSKTPPPLADSTPNTPDNPSLQSNNQEKRALATQYKLLQTTLQKLVNRFISPGTPETTSILSLAENSSNTTNGTNPSQSKQSKKVAILPEGAQNITIDSNGNTTYTLDNVKGITFVADQSPPDSTNNKSALVEQSKNNTLIPKSIFADEAQNNTYSPRSIELFNERLQDPNYRPVDNPLLKVIGRVELTPEAKLLNKASKLIDTNGQPYDISTKSLSQIAADVRAVENQFGNNKNNTVITIDEKINSLKYLPRQFLEKVIEAFNISPNLKLSQVEVKAGEHRYLSAKYLLDNQEWIAFTEQVKTKIPDEKTANQVISAIQEKIVTDLKSSLTYDNPDFKISNKDLDHDTIIDYNTSRTESIELLKYYFDNSFPDQLQQILNSTNNILNGGTIRIIQNDQYVDYQIPKELGLQLNIADYRPSKFIVLYVSQDPDVNSFINVINNQEAYLRANGRNNEILNAVFGYQLLKEDGFIINDSFPVIEQPKLPNDPSAISHYVFSHYVSEKKIDVTGIPIDPTTIRSIDVNEYVRRTKTRFTDFVNEKVRNNPQLLDLLTNYIYDGVPLDGLISQLNSQNKVKLDVNGPLSFDQVFKEGASVEFANDAYILRNTNQVANDIAGYSTTLTTVAEVARTLSPADGVRLLEGTDTIYKVLQDTITIKLQEVDGFNTYEHAGDGIRGTTENQININTIKSLVDLSTLYQKVINDSLKGFYGPNAKMAADVINTKLGDSVYLKVGIGTGDTLFQYMPGNVEIKSSVRVDDYLDNVKKLIKQEKDAGRTPPSEIIGVSKSVYDMFTDQQLGEAGLIKIERPKFNGEDSAYFIQKIQDQLNIFPEIVPGESRNNTPKIKIIETTKNILPTDLLPKIEEINHTITDNLPKLKTKITAKSVILPVILAIKSVLGIFLFINTQPSKAQSLPTPTPTVIVSPTVTSSPTVTIQPTITIAPTITPSPTFTIQPTQTLTPENKIYSNLIQSDSINFANNAKIIGDMIISCQNQGIISGPDLKQCFCDQTINKCQSGSIEERIAKKLSEVSGDSNLLQCLEFVNLVELTRHGDIVTFSNVPSIEHANDLLKPGYKNNYYYCPKKAVEKTGFINGDVIMYEQGSDGHMNICVNSKTVSCEVIEANKKNGETTDNGLVQYRNVDNTKESYDGVYRYNSNGNDPSLDGCVLRSAN